MTCLVSSPPGFLSREGRSARLIGWSPKKTRCSRSMVTTRRCSVISRTVLVLGTATSMPDCKTGAEIMKITSRTSTTSTSGVMLISARAVWVCPLLVVNATRFPLAASGSDGLLRADVDVFHAVEQLAGEVVHARAELAQAAGELVIGNDGGHGDEQARGGGDERLGDSRSNGAQRRRAGGAEAVEGVHDTH